MTAFDSAITASDRVVAVVGVGAGLGGFEGATTPDEMAIFETYESLGTADPYDADALTAFEADVWLEGPGQPRGRVPAAVRTAFLAMARPLNERGRIEGRPIEIDPPADRRLADLRCPVLAMALVWPDVAHMIGMEAPDRLAAAIVDFLAPLERWS